MHSCISGNAFPPTISVLRVESSFLLQFCIHVSVAQIILPGGSQAHSGTLIFYCGLRQAQILYVDSTCKTCGGVKPSVGYYKKTDPRCYIIIWSPQSGLGLFFSEQFVLRDLLPLKPKRSYKLRPGAHDYVLPIKKVKNFVSRYLYQLSRIRPMLDFETPSNIDTSIVHSKLDYC